MIPTIPTLSDNITEVTYQDRTYKIKFAKNPIAQYSVLSMTSDIDETETGRIDGYTDGLDAIVQAIYLILSTERYQHIIYSWDYGVELLTLIGKPMSYVIAELPRRITEALMTDNRIKEVSDFQFEKRGKQLHTTFNVVTDIGTISTEMGVAV